MTADIRENDPHDDRGSGRISDQDQECIRAHLDEKVFGHGEAKRILSRVMRDYEYDYVSESGTTTGRHVILTGPPGIGKTRLAREAARASGIPFASANLLTALNLRSSSNPLRRLVAGLAGSVPSTTECIDHGVICLEHVECLTSQNPEQADVRAAQQALASLLEGEEFMLAIDGRLRHFSTRRMLFVATATVGPRNRMPVVTGFKHEGSGAHSILNGHSEAESDSPLELPLFLLENFESLIQVHGFGASDLERFLVDPAFSPLAALIDEARARGITLTVEPGVLQSLVSQVGARRSGIRGLVRLTRRCLMPIIRAAGRGTEEHPRRMRLSRMEHEGEAFFHLADDSESVALGSHPLARLALPLGEERADESEGPAADDSLLLNCRPPRPEAGFLGSHRLATEEDLSPYLVHPEGDQHTSTLEQVRPIVEATKDGAVLRVLSPRPLYLPSEVRRTHILVVGKTGSGKTTKVILPIMASDIRDPERTVIILDAQLDLTHRALALAHRFAPRKKIYYLNFKDPNHSLRWNMVQGITSQRDAFEISTAIVESNPQPRDGDSLYFRSQAILLQASIMLELNRWMPARANMSEILKMVESGPEAMQLLANLSDNEFLRIFAKRATENRNYETVLADLQNQIGLWRDEDVTETTVCTEFNFQDIENQASIVIVAMPEQDMVRMRPLTNCFINRLFSYVMDAGARGSNGRLKRPFSLIADEFASAVGKIADLTVRINTLRKRDLSVVAAVQTIGQISEVYGSGAQSLLAGFGSTIFIPPIEVNDAEFASRKGGTMSIIEVPANVDVDVPALRPTSRPLLTEVEIASPRRTTSGGMPATLFLPGIPPFQAYLPGAYELEGLSVATDSDVAKNNPLSRRTRALASAEPAATFRDSRAAAPSTREVEMIRHLEAKIPSDTSGFAAMMWWKSTRARLPAPTSVLILVELIRRGATLNDLHEAFNQAGTPKVEAVLHYLDFLKSKNRQ